MNKQTSQIMAFAAITGLFLVLTGCSGMKTITRASSFQHDQLQAVGGTVEFTGPEKEHGLSYQWTHDGTNIFGQTGLSLVLTNVQFEDAGTYKLTVLDRQKRPRIIGQPYYLSVYRATPTGGTLSLAVGQASRATDTTGCFPRSDGWDKYFLLRYFLGPFTANPTGNLFPNPNNLIAVTVNTCNSTNGTQLQTGVVIMDNVDPAKYTCEGSSCEWSNLQGAQFTHMEDGHKYRAGIFYKSSTLGGRTKIYYNWNYP